MCMYVACVCAHTRHPRIHRVHDEHTYTNIQTHIHLEVRDSDFKDMFARSALVHTHMHTHTHILCERESVRERERERERERMSVCVRE